jgi:GNAT superfamily N-acetyltransferase
VNVESARPATSDDRARLGELVAAARAELVDQRGGLLHLLRDVRAIADDDRLLERSECVVVGEYDDVVVGYAALHVERLSDGTDLAVLDDIYVEPEAREVGVGDVVMRAVLEWCRNRRCRGVDAVALPGNRAMKNFFERFGLTARAIVVHRPLGGDIEE